MEVVEAFMNGVKDKKQYMFTAMGTNYVVLALALITILFVKKDSIVDQV